MPRATWNGAVLAEADAAKHLKGFVAFWKGVEVKQVSGRRSRESGSPQLDCNGHALAKKLGREVRAVRPGERMKNDRELLEILAIPQRFKYRSIEFRGKIDLAGGTVAELDCLCIPRNASREIYVVS